MTPTPEERRVNCALHSEKIDRMENDLVDFKKEAKDDRVEILSLLNKLNNSVHGNGKMGLCGKVDVLWNTGLFIATGLCLTFGALLWDMVKNQGGELKYKLVLVTWIDAESDATWGEVDKTKEWADKDYEVLEIGWEIYTSPKYTVICSQIGNDGSLGNRTKIPNKWIVKKRVMRNGQGNRTNTTQVKKNRKAPKRNEG